MSKPFLPLLKPDFKNGLIGEWFSYPQMLTKLPENIEIGQSTSPKSKALTAIPTIWARPCLFQAALFSVNHPLHKPITNEWRGLLGIFALSDILGLSLEFSNRIQYENIAGNFAKALTILQPDEAWKEIYTVKLVCGHGNQDKILIACTSPTTLFFTPPQIKIPENIIKWQNKDGYLEDPVNYLRKTNIRWLGMLKGWINKLHGHFEKSNHSHRSEIQGALRLWREEISDDMLDVKINVRSGFMPINLRMPSSPMATKIQDQQPSDFRLKARRKVRDTPIIIWEEGWKDRKKVVIDSYTTDSVPIPAGDKGSEFKVGTNKIEGFWINPEKYFLTDTIIKVNTNKENVLLHNNYGFLLPLKSSVLDYFEPKDLESIFHWTKNTNENYAEVELQLPIGNGSEKAIFIKSYCLDNPSDKQGKIIKINTPPILALWPDFKANDWTHYYLYIQRAKELADFDICPTEDLETESGQGPVKRLLKYPEAFIFKHMEDPAGLILVNWPKEIKAGVDKWHIGVDFGTSNCTLSKKVANNHIEPLIFIDRSLILTDIASDQRINLGKEFIYAILKEAIFPTIYHKFGAVSAPKALLDGVIVLFSPGSIADIFATIDKNSIVENLKWADNPENGKYLSPFLKQLFIMIAAEAREAQCGEIELYWSYPTAFSKKAFEGGLQQFWEKICMGIAGELGLTINQHSSTESIAVCNHAKVIRGAKPASSERPQVVVDIGGGTTDIGIWGDNGLLFQTSVRIAGNNIAHIFISDKSMLRKLEEATQLSDQFDEEYESETYFNIILRRGWNNIGNSFIDSMRDEQPVKRAKSVVLFQFEAIFYFIGLILRNVMGGKITGADIYLAGNGSQFIQWIPSPNNGEKIIKDSIEAGLGRSLETELFPPSEPKMEVAKGLLCDGKSLKSLADHSIITGEAGYRINDRDISCNENIFLYMKEKENTFRIVPPSEFPELKKLSTLNKKHCDVLGLYPLKKGALSSSLIKAHVEQYISDELNKEYDNRSFQPFFIVQALYCLENGF